MYGILPPRRLPKQDPGLILITADRWARAAAAHEKWATAAKLCFDFVESKQWDQATLREFARQKRPALTLNKVGRMLRLVLGYFENNKTVIKYLPGQDAVGSEDTAETLNKLSAQIDEMNEMQFVHTEVSMDGLIGGRGYYKTLLDFSENDFGEEKTRAADPFSIYPDPEGETYDLNDPRGGCGFVFEKRVVSIDEVEWTYGKEAAQYLGGFLSGYSGGGVSALMDLYANADIGPDRGFGGLDYADRWLEQVSGMYGDLVDPYRKTITLLDKQYWVRRIKRQFIDLETGDRKTIPDTWDDEKIKKVLWYAEQVGNPVTVATRPVRTLRWTTFAGPIMVYDSGDECPYDRFSLTGYFPYFRRGKTRGMVEDLIDPQREVNKRRSASIEILSKTANGGWKIHKTSLDQRGKANLKNQGSTPGFILEWEGEHEPKQIAPEVPIQRMRQLEEAADADFGEISGINESALGDIDKVQSGRAIEARQRQAVVSVQTYITNRNRAIQLLGKKRLSIIQNHYTEGRILRITGEDGRTELLRINDRVTDPMGRVLEIKNNVTLGKYMVAVDETPISATFLAAQFDEALMLLEKMGPIGAQLLQMRPDLLVEMSSLPRKKEWVAALQQALGAMGGGGAPGQPLVDPATGAVMPGTAAATAPSMDQGVGPGAQIIQLNPAGGPAA